MKKIAIVLLLLMGLFFSGCVAQDIGEIKKEEFVGKTVVVSGEAQGVIKIGDLSGYTIVEDDGDSIAISSKDLPEDGTEVTVRGTLMKDTIFGYYIKED